MHLTEPVGFLFKRTLVLMALVWNFAGSFSQPELDAQSPALVPIYDLSMSPYCIFAALAEIEETTLSIFAPNGEALYQRVINDFCYDFKLHPNGLLSYFEEDIAGFVLLDSLFNPLDTIRTAGYRTDYHELRILEDGSYLMIGLDPRSIDMSEIIEGGNEDATVVGNVIQKLDKGKNLIFQWNSFDHFDILDSYADKKFYTVDYVHINAIEPDTDSTIIVSSRNMSELTRIDLRTGVIIWRLGGKNNQFVFRDFDRMFSGQHAIRRKRDKIFTLYDNGLHSDPHFSMGIEFTLDEDSLIVEKISEFRQDPDIYSSIMGNVQNLDNGNTLVSWGGNTFTEYDEDHVIVHKGVFINCDIPTYGVNKYVWKNHSFSADHEIIDFGSIEVGDSTKETVVLENLLNEELVINDFAWSTPAFNVSGDTIALLPGEKFETEVYFKPGMNGPFIDTLTLRSKRADHSIAIQLVLTGTGYGGPSSAVEGKASPSIVYPVPFNEILSYRSDYALEKIEIWDLNGRVVLAKTNPEKEGSLDTLFFEPGFYIISIHHRDKICSHFVINKSTKE